MKCPSCQSVIADTATFCPFCGDGLAAVPAQYVPEPHAEPMPEPHTEPMPEPPRSQAAYVRSETAGRAAGRHVLRRAGAALRRPKSGADTAFGVLASILGALSLIAQISLLLYVAATFIDSCVRLGEYDNGEIEAVITFAVIFSVLLSASVLLIISGAKSYTRGRGGVLAVVSAGLNLLFFLFLACVAISLGFRGLEFDWIFQALVVILFFAGLSLVKPLLVFICLPIRGAASRWHKSGADTAFGVLASIFGALSLIVQLPLLLFVAAEFISDYVEYGEYSNGDIEAIITFAVIFSVLFSASVLLIISGVKSCTRGRGGVLAVVSAGLNLLFFLFFAGMAIRRGFEGLRYARQFQMFLIILILASLSLVKPLLVFIFLPIRRSMRRQRTLEAQSPTIHT